MTARAPPRGRTRQPRRPAGAAARPARGGRGRLIQHRNAPAVARGRRRGTQGLCFWVHVGCRSCPMVPLATGWLLLARITAGFLRAFDQGASRSHVPLSCFFGIAEQPWPAWLPTSRRDCPGPCVGCGENARPARTPGAVGRGAPGTGCPKASGSARGAPRLRCGRSGGRLLALAAAFPDSGQQQQQQVLVRELPDCLGLARLVLSWLLLVR